MTRLNYALKHKLCAKLSTKHKLLAKIMCYVPKAKLCAIEPISYFSTRSHNRIILKGLVYNHTQYKQYIFIELMR